MKIHLLSFALLLLITQTKAQTSVYHPFPDSDAVWNIGHIYGIDCAPAYPFNESFSYTIAGDTVINSLNYHKLFIPFVQKKDTCIYFQLPPLGYAGCLRQDIAAKKVFFISLGDTAEYILYDFNLQPGDSLFIPVSSCNINPAGYLIKRTDSILIGPDYRKKLITYSGFSIIEGIGYTTGLLEPCTFVPDHDIWHLTCFQQNGSILYHPDTTMSCNIIASVNKLSESDNSILVYPNPVTNQLTIRTSSFHNEAVTISIINVLGEIVQQEKLKWINNISMNINNLPAGFYFLQMKSESGSVVKKFVKE